MAACGIDLDAEPSSTRSTSTRATRRCILGYEEALTRRDSPHRRLVRLLGPPALDRRAHPPARRRARGVPRAAWATRSACKLGPRATADEAVELCETPQPRRVPGPAHADHPDGRDRVEDRLPPLLRAVRDAGHPVVWACDPMHGNTFITVGRHKTRHLDDSSGRDRAAFSRPTGPRARWPGGVHVELTGDDVTECLGGAEEILDQHLDTATRRCATPGSTPASRSTSRSAWPSCCATAPSRPRPPVAPSAFRLPSRARSASQRALIRPCRPFRASPVQKRSGVRPQEPRFRGLTPHMEGARKRAEVAGRPYVALCSRAQRAACVRSVTPICW